MYIILLLLLFLILLFLLWYLTYVIISCILPSKRAPFVSSFDRDIRLLKELKLKRGKKIIDLGCGSCKALRFFHNYFGLVGTGYDINFFAIMISKIWNKLGGYQIQVFWDDFYKADLKKYDYVYVFLLPGQLAQIEDWLRKSVNKNCIIISNSFLFKKNKPFKTIVNKGGYGKIYLYKS